MSSEDRRKCFTFIWTIENISYCWQETTMPIKSPKFTIGEIKETTFHLSFYPRGSMEGYENYIGFYLKREEGCCSLKLDCELSLLSINNVVLTSAKYENVTYYAGSHEFKERKDIFFYNRSVYLSQDKLRARCRIWKTDEGMTEDVQCIARTRICIEKVSFFWDIQNFSSLRPKEKHSKQIKSVLTDEVLITFDLFLKNGKNDEELINIQLVSHNDMVKYFVLHLTALNEMIRNQSIFHDTNEAKFVTLPFSKKNLLANKNQCLPNDVLSFRGECIFSNGKVLKEIEKVIYGCENFQTIEAGRHFFPEENSQSISMRTLSENLKSLFYDNILPDIMLKTSSEIYHAHKSILSARSPVFKAMFSNNMKEKFSDCVNIEDLDSNTVYRMLQYLYTAEIKDLQFEDAFDLYRAADKYEILTLRDQCSAFLKCNFSPSNVCDTLILADTHQDKDLKTAAQDFIFDHDVVNTEEWIRFLQTHLKLAADTMFNQIQKMKNKWDWLAPGICSSTVDTNASSCFRALSSSSTEERIEGSSFVSPEPEGNIAGTSTSSGFATSSATQQRGKRIKRRGVRRLERSNIHSSALPARPVIDSLPAPIEANVATPYFRLSESDENAAGASTSFGSEKYLREMRRLMWRMRSFKATREQSRK